MIIKSTSLKVVALGTAAALHIVTGHVFSSDPEIKIESGAGAQQAALGSSFADMVAGKLTPLDATEMVEAESATDKTETTKTYEKVQTPKAQKIADVEPAQTPAMETLDALPQQQPTPTPQLPQSATTSAIPTDTAEAPAVTFSQPVVSKTIQLAPVLAASPKATSAQTSQTTPIVTAMLAQPQTSAVITPSPSLLSKPDVITGDTPETAAPTTSKRPSRRKVDLAKVVKKPTVAKPKKQATKRGNSNRNNTQGSATGTPQDKAKVQSNGRAKASASGNAAINNYRGKVMRKLSRVRRPKTKAKGTAIISFRVSASGGISALSVAHSSGSGALDNAAMGVVRKAAPFPAPPKGAKREFSIDIKFP